MKISNKIESLKRGDILQIYYNKNNPQNKRLHVIENLKEDKQIVFKSWNKYRQDWVFEVWSYLILQIYLVTNNCLKFIKIQEKEEK